MKMNFWVRVNSEEKRIDIDEKDGIYTLDIDGVTRKVDCQNAGHRDYLSLIINNKSHLVEIAAVKIKEGSYYATINGRRYDVDVLDERLVATRQASEVIKDSGSYVISSPMPGLIVDVRVKVGDSVKAGAAVVVMEAMKMQNELVSEVDGVVKTINIKAKDAVDSQEALIEIEKADQGSE